MSQEPTHTEADDLHETHVTHFQLAGTDQEMILSCGEMRPRITSEGDTEINEIVYDTKLRMSHQTAAQLYQLLDQTIQIDQDEEPDAAGRGVQ